MQFSRQLCILLLSAVCNLSPLMIPGSAYAEESSTNGTSTSNTISSDKLPLADLQRFTTVVEYIKTYYVKPVEDSTLFESAIRGMLAGLDPHSSYLDTDEFEDLKVSTTGKFGGLGIEVTLEDGFVRVISPYDDAPASRAGVQAGDLIVRINDTPVKGLSLQAAVALMRGDKGTQLVVTIIRQGEPKPLLLTLTRDIINIQSVRSKTLEDQFGYIRISQFQNNSGEELKRAVTNLKKSNGGKLKGLILDLRNNPGGILDASVQISDTFLDKDKLKYDGVIVYTKGRTGSQIREKAHSGDALNGAPIVVLVNGGSASASEIVAGALQDHHRAVIIGTQTFGKGSVQTVLPLKDQRGLKLTTALYYTPAGRSIQATGIKPDITVQNLKIPNTGDKEQNSFLLREEDLQRHLENSTTKPGSTGTQPTSSNAKQGADINTEVLLKSTGQKTDKSVKPEEPLISTDYQLYEALNVLKGLTLLYADKG